MFEVKCAKMGCVRYFSFSAMRFAQILLWFGLMALVSSQVGRWGLYDASGKIRMTCVVSIILYLNYKLSGGGTFDEVKCGR